MNVEERLCMVEKILGITNNSEFTGVPCASCGSKNTYQKRCGPNMSDDITVCNVCGLEED